MAKNKTKKKYKLKTHRGAAKRFKKAANNKFKRKRAFKNHILTKKDSKRKRQLRAITTVSEPDANSVKNMLIA